MNQIDASYRQVFGTHAIVRDLLRLPWLEHVARLLDLSSLTPMPTALLSQKLQERHADIVWQARTIDGGQACLLLHIEHQSRPDKDMALRMMSYRALLYESLRRAADKRKPLPALIPVVLYSGTRRWKAVRDVRCLIEPVHESLEIFQPKLEYLLVDERDVVQSTADPESQLEDNLAWLQFRLEHNQGPQDTTHLFERFAALTEGPDGEPARAAIASWARYVLLSRELPKNPDISQLPALNFTEIVTMLTDTRRPWYQQWMEEGRVEGRVEGEAQMLQRQLTRRFGPLTQETIDRLKTATAAQLETWGLNLLDAPTLEDVFRD